MFRHFLSRIDWLLLLSVLPIAIAGLVTMASFGSGAEATGIADPTLIRQTLWLLVSLVVCFMVAQIDIRLFTRTHILIGLYIAGCMILLLVLAVGATIKGATSWFSFGGFSFQPSDPMKIILILVLAKYLSRRHVEIASPRHLLITGAYAAIPFLLVFIQPDLGSSLIFGAIWFGMVLVAGISRKHLLVITGGLLACFLVLWLFVLAPYQKARIMNFIHPLSDIRGTGYNAYQSAVAVGSGQWLGKGPGFGTQSRLNFLPEYKTDFIFAAYAEEWGFVGAFILLLFYLFLLKRILGNAERGASNFETLLGVGIAISFISHIAINIGMNLTLMPVTGITLPFMSYGGSHLLSEFLALGLLMSAREGSRTAHRDDTKFEFLGLE